MLVNKMFIQIGNWKLWDFGRLSIAIKTLRSSS